MTTRNACTWGTLASCTEAQTAGRVVDSFDHARPLWWYLPMLPVLLFELLWKLVWVGIVALPAWRQDQLGTYGMATLIECLPVFVLFPLVIPWRYALARYLRKPGLP